MAGTSDSGGAGGGEFMLFGVRVVVDSMRKSVSLNNLSQYEQPQDLTNKAAAAASASGYASADDAVPHPSGSRKRGVPWTEEEHKQFLLGLQKVGKGDWRGISRNFVKTRTPTQVASHAQKYFLRRSNLNRRRRRRSSLFDITTDSVAAVPMEEERSSSQDNKNINVSKLHPLPPSPPETSINGKFPLMQSFPITNNPTVIPVSFESPMESMPLGHGNKTANPPLVDLVRPIPVLTTPHASTICDLNLNLTSTADPSPLSLKLSLPSDQKESSSRHSAFQSMPGFNGDSIISVA